ncbi:MAG: TIGR04255 family protein [Betaproteobacteria bacterium]|nr:TIGR04255 family protein [Betaproteobacteria bacterium]
MNNRLLNLESPPIVEAVLDIECDMSHTLALDELEASARDAFLGKYPKFRTQIIQALQVEAGSNREPSVTARQGIHALHFLHEDEKQLVQVRPQGFSFNRLAPYAGLDGYLPEMERTWRLFAGVAKPAQIRIIRLRYINRILLPMAGGRVDLDQYLRFGPKLPDEDRLTLVGFLNQHSAVEVGTGHQVNMIMTAQVQENDKLPVILDIEAINVGNAEPDDWAWIHSKIQSLRRLKNHVFENSLTDQCLALFQR